MIIIVINVFVHNVLLDIHFEFCLTLNFFWLNFHFLFGYLKINYLLLHGDSFFLLNMMILLIVEIGILEQ